MERLTQFFPESLVGYIRRLKITEFFFTHFKIQTARREGTPLTPSITVVINAGYMLRVPIIFVGHIIFHRYQILF
jgi:hypothetical protein